MKKELNLKLDEHVKLLQDIAVKAIDGIDVKEVIELKKLHNDRATYEYFNRIKLKYIIGLGMLELTYNITPEAEKYVFLCIHSMLHQLPY